MQDVCARSVLPRRRERVGLPELARRVLKVIRVPVEVAALLVELHRCLQGRAIPQEELDRGEVAVALCEEGVQDGGHLHARAVIRFIVSGYEKVRFAIARPLVRVRVRDTVDAVGVLLPLDRKHFQQRGLVHKVDARHPFGGGRCDLDDRLRPVLEPRLWYRQGHARGGPVRLGRDAVADLRGVRNGDLGFDSDPEELIPGLGVLRIAALCQRVCRVHAHALVLALGLEPGVGLPRRDIPPTLEILNGHGLVQHRERHQVVVGRRRLPRGAAAVQAQLGNIGKHWVLMGRFTTH